MNLSEIFIRRPVMTILVMVTIAFFGVLSYRALPTSDLPDVDFPTIEVDIDYPGADPETMANNVVVPLERQFASIPGIQTISSVSYTGSANIVLQFVLHKSIDIAGTDVQAAINAADPQLPQNLPYAPTYSKVNPTSSPVLFLVVTSPTMTYGDLYEYGNTILGQRISMVDGVSQVQTFGTPYAVRLQVDPQKLAAKKIGLDEVGTAIQNANVYLPTGTLFGQKNEFTIDVNGQMYVAEAYNNTIIKTDNGAIVRFRDIGQALDSTQNDKYFLKYFDKELSQPMVGLAILKQPGSNTLAVIERINKIIPDLETQIPGSIKLVRIYDQSEYIQGSVRDVKFTLFVALCLVVLVIFFYLGKFVDTFIPAMAIPMSVLGTFIVMNAMGYTIDVLSLLGITLVIGFLVDDAIVVLENIVRHVENGEDPFQAALTGTKEISFTIVSMTLCLASVFIPLLFMEGIVGRVLHEFSVTIVSAVLISGFISLTLTPLLCSRLIPKRGVRGKKTRMEHLSLRLNEKLLSIYHPSLEWVLHHRKIAFFIGSLSLVFTILLLVKLPKDFLPDEDIGFIECYTQAADGTSPFLMGKYQERISNIIKEDPNVSMIVAIGSMEQDNQGIIYVRLKDISERLPMRQAIKELYKKVKIPGLQVYLKPVPLINLQVGAQLSKGDYQYTLQSLDPQALYKAADAMMKKMQALPGFADVASNLDITQPQLKVEIQRDRAYMLNVTAQQIENVLNLAFADSNLSPINEPSNQYYAIMEVLPKFYRDPSKMSQIWLRSSTGNLVPLSEVVNYKETLGPLTVSHINGLPSASISFNLNDVSLGTALTNLEKTARQTLPPTVTGVVQGTASVFKDSFANLNFLLIITVFMIYVILGILYENFLPPLTVMSTLPPAALGGLLSLLIFGYSLSLYGFVGVILLLGIVMKNGIIMIDFANDAVTKEGKTPHDAIVHACMIRFRPILMTTVSALMGSVPIALGIGGLTAQGRQPLGIVIIGGLIFSQILTLYLTPVTYLFIEDHRQKFARKKAEKEALRSRMES